MSCFSSRALLKCWWTGAGLPGRPLTHPREFPGTPACAPPSATDDDTSSSSPTASSSSLTVSTCCHIIPIYYATYIYHWDRINEWNSNINTKILLCHVFVPVLPGNAGGPEPACWVAPLTHPHEFPDPPSVTSDDVLLSSCHIVSHIELIISNSEHVLVPFPPYNVQQTYIIRIVLSSRVWM